MGIEFGISDVHVGIKDSSCQHGIYRLIIQGIEVFMFTNQVFPAFSLKTKVFPASPDRVGHLILQISSLIFIYLSQISAVVCINVMWGGSVEVLVSDFFFFFCLD